MASAKRKTRQPGTPPGSPPGTPDFADGVSLAEAAELVGVSERTLRRRIKGKQLAAKRDNAGRWLVSRAELETMAQGSRRGRRKGSAQPGMPGGTPHDAELTPLLATVLQLNRELGESRQREQRLLTAGDVDRDAALRELTAERERRVKAETSRRWALILAGLAGAAAVTLAVALVMRWGA